MADYWVTVEESYYSSRPGGYPCREGKLGGLALPGGETRGGKRERPGSGKLYTLPTLDFPVRVYVRKA